MLFAVDVVRYSADHSPLAQAVDLVYEDPPAWLPSYQRGQESTDQIIDVGAAILDDPSLIWQAISDPYVSAWAQCRYGEAIGRGVFEVGTALLPAGLAARLATLSRVSRVSTLADMLTVLRRGETVAPDEYAGALARLVEEARANGDIKELLKAARRTDTLDELIAHGRLTSAEIAFLREAGRAALLAELRKV